MSFDGHIIDNFPIDTIRHTLPYASEHSGKFFLVHLPYEAIQQEHLSYLMRDFLMLSQINVHIFLTFDIESALMSMEGAPEKVQEYLPISDELLFKALALIHQSEDAIEAFLSSSNRRQPHQKVSTFIKSNFFTAQPIGLLDGVPMEAMGVVRNFHHNLVAFAQEHRCITLLSPKAFSISGKPYLLHSKDIMATLIEEMHFDKIILFSKEKKISIQGESFDTLIPEQLNEVDELDERWKYELLQSSVAKGISRAHFLSYRDKDSLLTELFTVQGHGTQIVNDPMEKIKSASLEDVEAIYNILQPGILAQKILPKTRQEIINEIGSFLILQIDHQVVGCVSLKEYVDESMLEIACLAVDRSFQEHTTLFFNQTFANALIEQAFYFAKEKGFQKCFALSTQTIDWFLEHGFEVVDIDQLPFAKQQNYNYERSSKVLLKYLL